MEVHREDQKEDQTEARQDQMDHEMEVEERQEVRNLEHQVVDVLQEARIQHHHRWIPWTCPRYETRDHHFDAMHPVQGRVVVD